jgi:hypothetical protein
VRTYIPALLSHATGLEELTIGMPLPAYLFNALLQSFGSMQHLHSISLRGSGLADARCTQLCAALSDYRTLKSLDLTGCSLTDIGASAVAALLKHNADTCASESLSAVMHRA